MPLLLGTANEGKIREMNAILSSVKGLRVVTGDDVPFSSVDETGETFAENALLKAWAVCDQTQLPVLAEDAGLEVAALHGAPGVYSARYSGLPVDYARNNDLLLKNLEGIDDRRARFIAVAALCLPDGQVFVTTGILRGTISLSPSGRGGFGYDPLFVPDDRICTLAEMPAEEKNAISHRRQSLHRMLGILKDLLISGELDG